MKYALPTSIFTPTSSSINSEETATELNQSREKSIDKLSIHQFIQALKQAFRFTGLLTLTLTFMQVTPHKEATVKKVAVFLLPATFDFGLLLDYLKVYTAKYRTTKAKERIIFFENLIPQTGVTMLLFGQVIGGTFGLVAEKLDKSDQMADLPYYLGILTPATILSVATASDFLKKTKSGSHWLRQLHKLPSKIICYSAAFHALFNVGYDFLLVPILQAVNHPPSINEINLQMEIILPISISFGLSATALDCYLLKRNKKELRQLMLNIIQWANGIFFFVASLFFSIDVTKNSSNPIENSLIIFVIPTATTLLLLITSLLRKEDLRNWIKASFSLLKCPKQLFNLDQTNDNTSSIQESDETSPLIPANNSSCFRGLSKFFRNVLCCKTNSDVYTNEIPTGPTLQN